MNNDAQLVTWATSVLEELLVKSAIDLHTVDTPAESIEKTLTFQVAADQASGVVSVRSLGSRGKRIDIAVPLPADR